MNIHQHSNLYTLQDQTDYFLLNCYTFLSKAHVGYLHLVSTSLKCSFFSVLSSSDVVLTALALWWNVFVTLFGHFVIVAIPVQVLICVAVLPINTYGQGSVLSSVTKVSKNGMEPSGHASSTVNLTDCSMLLTCFKKQSCLFSNCCTTKV